MQPVARINGRSSHVFIITVRFFQTCLVDDKVVKNQHTNLHSKAKTPELHVPQQAKRKTTTFIFVRTLYVQNRGDIALPANVSSMLYACATKDSVPKPF